MHIEPGLRVVTPDGAGVVSELEKYGWSSGTRIGVKHDEFPQNHIPGFFENDVLYYDENEISLEI